MALTARPEANAAQPVAPMSLTEQPESTINITQIGPGKFFVDLGREIQGGLRLQLKPKVKEQLIGSLFLIH